MSILYCLYFLDSPNLKGQVPVFISPQEQGSPVIPLGNGLSETSKKVEVMLRLTDSQSVKYVLASSPLWNLWPDIIFCLKVAVLFLWGAPSDERSGLSFDSHCQHYLVHCQNFILFTFYMSHMFYVYTIYTRPLSANAQYSRSCPSICSLHYNSSLDTWMIVHLPTAKFMPLIFSILGFTLLPA
jgi:hypothetical protein